LITKSFNVHEKSSIGKLENPVNESFGYRSMKFICDFGEYRENLPEFKQYKGMVFEIQVRSVLQHTLLEFEHGRNNIFSGILPSHLKRRLQLVAGLLESADRELDSLAKDLSKYTKKVTRNTKAGDLKMEINTSSLKEYLNEKIKIFKKTQFVFNGHPKLLNQIIREMTDFDLDTLDDVDNILNKQFLDLTEKHIAATNEIGLLRNAMLFTDINKYFKNAWKKRWFLAEESPVEIFKEKYGSKTVLDVFNNYGISTYPDTVSIK